MRVGIITYYDITNYGSALQAFAMQEYLKALGHEVVFLQYERDRIILPSTRSWLYKLIHFFSPNAIYARAQENRKIRSVADFRKRFFVIGNNFAKEKGLDCILVGSDQIFDCKYEFYPYQYAVGVQCDKVFSYAPSFGEFTFDQLESFEHLDELTDALKKFEGHSCRDENTRKILSRLLEKEPVRVLDPTLLYGFEKEKKTWNRPIIKDKYVLIYTWGGTTVSAEFQKGVSEFAAKHQCKVLSVGDYRKWCDYNYAYASPEEFFSLVRNSSAVITNMFHGSCFSIINERPFYSLVMPHNRNNLYDLLQYLGLETQVVWDVNQLGELPLPAIDYERVNAFLSEKREVSDQYCKERLDA